MNKIYKLVWSKVKNMYVAVAEIAKSHTKSPSSNIVGRVQLEKKVNLQLGKGFVYDSLPNYGFVAGDFATSHFFTPAKKDDFKITVAAIVKNEAKNVPQWVNAAKSCADEIVVVDTGSTDGTVERFADYGIKCFHYDWNDDFASAKNYMISLCHGDWIVLLDGDEWFREGCDVRKAIAKHHNNPVTKAIIADWICLDSTRNNAIMFSGGAVRAFRNSPEIRYFRKVHENLTIQYENFVFEPDFKMYHTGYSGDVNRSKHERNLRIMRTMFDFDNGIVEFPTDWRYIEDTYAGLGQFDKALWAADRMISYGVQEYSAAAWITKFNVLFAMKTPLAEMKKQFDYCFRTVPSVSGFRFLASIYYVRNGLVAEGLDNYIEGLRMLMGPQDKVAMEHTYWRMYMPEASALASAVYLQNKQFEASLYACKVCEQYCGQNDWTNRALADIRKVMNQTEESLLGNISERVLPVLQFGKKAVLATALASSLTIGMVGAVNPVFAGCVIESSGSSAPDSGSVAIGGNNNIAECGSVIIGGNNNHTAYGCCSIIIGGCNITAGVNSKESISVGSYSSTINSIYGIMIGSNTNSRINGFYTSMYSAISSTAEGEYSTVLGGMCNYANGFVSLAIGGCQSSAYGEKSIAMGGCGSSAYASQSIAIGGGVTGVSSKPLTAKNSIAIGDGATTTRNYEIAIGSSSAPVKIDGGLTVDGAKTVTDGTTTKTWSQLLNASGGGSGGATAVCFADGVVLAGCNNTASGCYSSVSGGSSNVAGCNYSFVSSGQMNSALGYASSVFGGYCNVASACRSVVVGGGRNTAEYQNSLVAGGYCNVASGEVNAAVFGGMCNSSIGYTTVVVAGECNISSGNWASSFGGSGTISYADYSSAIGGGITGNATCSEIATGSVAIGKNATTTRDYEIAIGSSCAPVKIDGALMVDGAKTVTDGTTTKSWTELLNASGGGSGSSYVGINVDSGSANEDGGGATGVDAIAIGKGAVASGDKAISIGTGNQVRGDNSGAIGDPNIVDAHNSYTVGNNSTISANVDGAFVMGNNVTVNNGTLPANWNSLTDEEKSDLTGEGVVALGNNVSVSLCNKVNSSRSSNSTGSPKIQHVVAVGDSAIVGEENAVALGYQAEAKALNALAGGTCAKALSEGATALGQGSIVHENSSFATAVGYEAEATGEGANAFGDNANAGAKFATAFGRATQAQCEASTAIGNCAIASASRTVAIGNETFARAEGATSIGNSSNAVTRNAVSIGNQAVANGEGVGVVAIGNCAQVGTVTSAKGSSTAVGAFANVQSTYSTALGAQTSVTANNSVALGAGSVASQANVVSVGAGTATDPYPATRKIINVTDGTVNTDVSTVGQTGRNLALSGSTLSLKNANGTVLDSVTLPSALTYTAGNGLALDTNNEFTVKAGTNVTVDANGVNVAGNGTVASGNTGLISGGTLHSEVRPASNGNYITTTGTTGSNLTALDTQLKTTTDNLATEITNRTNADTALGTRIDNVITAYQSADTGLSNRIGLVASDGTFIKKSATNDVATNLTALDTATKNAIKDLSVSGTTITYTKGDGTTGTITTQDNNTQYTAGNGMTLTGTEFSAKAGTNVTVDANGISVVGNGTVADGNTGLVSGGTLFTEGRVSADGNYVKANNTIAGNLSVLDTVVKTNADAIVQINTDLTGKANTSLNNITNDGKSVIKTNAKEAINVVGSGKATVNKTDVSGVDTYTVGVTVDGTVTEGNTGIVDGGTVYSALKAQETATNTALTGKANVALDNITEAGHNVIKSDAKSVINAIAGTHTTISKTDVNGVDTYAVNVTTDGAVADGNTGIVTGGTVYTAVNNEKTARETADTTLQENIDAEATTRQSADTALQESITAEQTARVTADTALNDRIGILSTDGNYIRQANNVSQNLVALDSAVNTLSDGKADIALSNINNDGKTVVRNLAREAVKVVNGTNTTVTEGTDGDAKTYAVNVTTDGVIAENNTGLVTGGTVYTAVNNEKIARETADTTLQGNIDAEATTRGNEDIRLAGLITAEETARQGVDTTLQTNITAEETARIAGDTALSDRIGTLSADGNYIRQANNVSQNLVALDGQVKANANAIVANKTKYFGVNAQFDEWTDENAEALKTKYNVTTKEEYEVLIANGLNVYGEGAVGDDSIAIGKDSQALSSRAISLGNSTSAGFSNAIALGNNSSAASSNAIALGNGVSSSVDSAISIGNSTVSSGTGSLSFGNSSTSSGLNSIAIGNGNTATYQNSIAIGNGITNNGISTVIGAGITTGHNYSVLLGDTLTTGGNSSIGIGHNISNVPYQAIAIGENIAFDDKGHQGIAIGRGTVVNDSYGIAIGKDAIVGDNVGGDGESLAIGNSANVKSFMSQAIGSEALVETGYSTALGRYAKIFADGDNSIGYNTALGSYTEVHGFGDNTAVGSYAKVLAGSENTALGNFAQVHSGIDATALGSHASSLGNYATSVGYVSSAGEDSVAIGRDARAGLSFDYPDYVPMGSKAVAVGSGTRALASNSIALGQSASSSGPQAVSLGSSAQSSGTDTIALGTSSIAGSTSMIAIGKEATATFGQDGLAIGTSSTAGSMNMIAIGKGASATSGADGLALGTSAVADSSQAIAIGKNASATSGADIISIGTNAQSTSGQNVAIGKNASAIGGHLVNSVALGSDSIATDSNTFSVGHSAYTKTVHNDTTNQDEEVQVAALTRRIMNVTDGVLDTDAATVGQLNSQRVDYVGVNAVWKDWADLTDAEKTALGISTEAEYDILVSSGANIHGDGAIGSDSIAIGRNSSAGVVNSVAIGSNSVAGRQVNNVTYGANSIAIGSGAQSFGEDGIAIGSGARTLASGIDGNQFSANQGIAIGKNALSNNSNAIAIGYCSFVTGNDSIALGSTSQSNGGVSIAIGNLSKANTFASVAVGYLAQAGDEQNQHSRASAFGNYAKALGQQSTALGENATAKDYGSLAVGYGSVADGFMTAGMAGGEAKRNYSIAIGESSFAKNASSTIVGAYSYTSDTNSEYASAFGYDNHVLSNYGIALGNYAGVSQNAPYSVAVGYASNAGNPSVQEGDDNSYASAFGVYANALAKYSTAIGHCAYARNISSLSVGDNSNAVSENSVAIGHNASAGSLDNVDTGSNAIAIGSNASASGTNSVALGSDSLVSDANVLSLGKNAVGVEGDDDYVPEYTRRIQHVTAGTADTDAVNVKQLNDQKVEYVGVNAVWKAWEDLTDEEKTALGVTTEAEYDVVVAGSNRNGEGARGKNSIAIGKNVQAGTLYESIVYGGDNSIVIGNDSTSKYNNNVIIGNNNTNNDSYAVNIGNNNTSGNSSVVLGHNNSAYHNSVVIGNCITALYDTILIGENISGTCDFHGVGVGYKASLGGYDAIAIGTCATANSYETIAIGDKTSTDSYMSSVVGSEATIHCSNYSAAYGRSTKAIDSEYGSALGSYAEVQNSIYGSALGSFAKVNSSYGSTAVGPFAKVTSACEGIAIGYNVEAKALGASALGSQAKALGQESLSLGYKSVADTAYSIAVGDEASAGVSDISASRATAIGYKANANGYSSVSIGSCSYAFDRGIAIGSCSNAKEINSMAIGDEADTQATNATAIGYHSHANAADSMAVGEYATVNSSYALAIGGNASATGISSVAIGRSSVTNNDESVALGYSSSANTYGSTVVGATATATGVNGTALGYFARANATDAVAIGLGSNVVGPEGIAIGTKSKATYQSIAIGGNTDFPANVNGSSSISIGYDSVAIPIGAIALGSDSNVSSSGGYGVAIGSCSSATGTSAIALGYCSTVKGNDTIAVGTCTNVNGSDGIAIGHFSKAEGGGVSLGSGTESGYNTVSIGYSAKSAGGSTIAIGHCASSNGGSTIAIGQSSQANGGNTIAIGYSADTGSTGYNVAIGSNAKAVDGTNSIALGSDSAVESNNYVLSLGRNAYTRTVHNYTTNEDTEEKVPELTRRITHVTAGVNDTDAVNVKQLNDQKVEYVGINAVWKDWADLTDDEKNALGVTTEVEYDAVVAGSNRNGEWAVGKNSIAIGKGAKAGYHLDNNGTISSYGDDNVAIGTNAYALNTGGVAIGKNSYSNGGTSIAIGQESVGGTNGIAIGYKSKSNMQGVSLGNEITVDTYGTNAVAIGYKTTVTGTNSIAVGPLAEATGSHAVAVGDHAKASETMASAFGENALASCSWATALGHCAVASGSSSTALGQEAKAVADSSLAVGTSAQAYANNSIAIGTGSTTRNLQAVSIGIGNNVTGANSIALGSGLTVNGANSGAFGDPSVINATNSYSVGNNNTINGGVSDVFVLGNNVTATNTDTVILGSGSEAKEDHVVSVGRAEVKDGDTVTQTAINRRIVNVGAGINDTDAVNVSQLTTGLDEKANVSLNNITDAGKTVIQNATNVVSGDNVITVTPTTENGVKTYTVTANISPDGQIAENNTGLVSGGTVYSEVRPSQDGNYIKTTNTTGANLTALDTQVKANADAITTNISDISNLKDLSNITEAGQNVIKELSKGSVNVIGTDKATVTKSDVSGVDTYTVSVKADGQVAQGNENIVSGGTVYDALSTAKEEIATDLAGKSNVSLNNVTDAGHTVIKTDAKSAINVVGGTYATVDKMDVNGVDTYTVNVATDGAVADGNAKLVTGGTVYSALQSQNTEIQTALDGKANVGLDNITDTGKSIVRTLAQESVKVVNGSNTTVTEGTDGTYKTYAVNTKTDGTVSSGDTGIVTGGVVYDAIQNAITGSEAGTAADLSGKANTALNNITDAGHDVIKSDAKSVISVAGNDDVVVNKTDVSGVDTYNLSINKAGAIASNNEGIVTGGTVFSETRPTSDGNYIAIAKSAGENLTALDTQVKANTDAISNINTGLGNKANTSLDNITSDGEAVIKNLAKGSVNVVGEGKATVTKTDVSGVDTYTVSVTADGSVVEGNENIVSGGTVYEAIRGAISTSEATTNTALEGKANVTLDNVTDAGHDVIKSDAKSVINVTDGEYATVEKTNVNGVDTYTINVATDGAVASGNTKLVTGGTVYEAMTAETRPASDGNYISATNTAGANLTALDSQVKTNADVISTNTSDIANLKDLSNVTGAGENVIKELSKGAVNVVGTDRAAVTKSDVNGVDTYTVTVKADGTVSEGNENIVSGGTVYTAIQSEASARENADTALSDRIGIVSADGNYIKASTSKNVSENLGLLDTALKSTADSVAGLSTDKANISLDNINIDGRTVIKNLAKDAVKVVDGTKTTVTEGTDGDAKTYAVNVTTDGAVAQNNEGIVTGGTVYNALQQQQLNTQTELVGKANVALDNITTAGHNVIKDDAKSVINVIGDGKASVDKSTVAGVDTYKVSVTANGAVAENNQDIVTGGAVYNAIQNAIAGSETGTGTALEGKANISLDNLNDAGNTVIQQKAIASVKVIDGENTTVTSETDADGNKTYKVKANATGTVTSGNENIVSGGTVYDAIQSAITISESGTNTALEGKANVDASNVTDAFAWGTKIATGTVAQNDVKAVSGDTMFSELRPADGNYVAQANTTAQNLTALDTQVKANKDILDTHTTDITNLKDLSNITEAGQNVVKELSKGSVNVVGNDKATVTKSDVSGVDTYTVSVKADGAVTDGNENIVSGGTVYNAIQTAIAGSEAGTGTALEGKANVDASNVTDATAWGTKIATGTVSDGDVKAVSGGTMFTEVRPADGNYVRQTNTTAQNLTALDTQVKTNTDNITANATDITNLKNLSNITEEGQNVIKNLSKGSVNVIGNGKIIVNKSDVSGMDTYTVGLTIDGNVASGDTGLVNGGQVADAISTAVEGISNDTDTKLEDYAKKDGSNVTTPATWGQKLGTGTVTENNSELVTGGTVYTAIRNEATTREQADTALSNHIGTIDSDKNYILKDNSVSDNLVVLDTAVKNNADAISTLDSGKADINLTNLTTTGETKVKTLAKGAVNVLGNGKVTVSKSDVDGTDTYTVGLTVDGTVTEGNAGLVTGGQVASAIKDAQDGLTGDISNKADKDFSNIDNTAKEVIRTEAKGAVNVIGNSDVAVTKSDVNGVDTYNLSVNKNGAVADSNEGIVTGGTMYTELRPADGNYVRNTNTTAQNLTALDTQVKSNTDTITELKDLSNITDAGKDVIKENAKGAVNVVGTGKVSVVKSDVSGIDTYTVGITVDGVVENGNTGIVDGGTVYSAIETAKTDVSSATDTKLADYALKDASNVTDSAAWGTAIGTGTVASGNNKLVTGSTVYDEVRPASDGNYVKKDNTAGQNISALDVQVKANADNIATNTSDITNLKDLSNITEAGQDVIKNLAKDTVNVTGTGLANVTKSTAEGVDTYTVDVVADGTISADDTKAVSGATVYGETRVARDGNYVKAGESANNNLMTLDTALKDVSDIANQAKDGVDGKANVSFDNISADGQNVIRELAKDSVKVVNGTNTTVTEGADGDVKTFAVNVTTNGTVTDGNKGIVTGGTVYDAIQDAINTTETNMTTALDSKANVDASNVTDAEAWGQKIATGSVASNDAKAVSGGTVYNAIENVKTELGNNMDTALTEYAKKDASNIQVPDWTAKLGIGTVASNDNNLVTGKKVFDEVRVTTDGNYVRSENTASQNFSALDTALKETREIAENAASTGADANAVHYDNADKNMITLAGENGTTITNLKDGTLSATSKDAVTGKQLYETNQNVQTNAQNIQSLTDKVGTVQDGAYVSSTNTIGENLNVLDNQAKNNRDSIIRLENTVSDLNTNMDSKLNTDLSNVTDDGKATIRDLAQKSVDATSNDGSVIITKTDADGVGNGRTFDFAVKKDGVVEEGNNDIVTGGAVYQAIQNIESANTKFFGVNNDDENDSNRHGGGATGQDAMAAGVSAKAEGVDSIAIGHGAQATGEKSLAVGTGNIVTGNRSGAFGDPNNVSGSDSYVMGNDNTVSGNNTFVIGNNVTATGSNSIVLGKGSDGSQDNVVSVGAKDKERKIVHVADGEISATSTDAVNGSQLYKVEQKLDDKANADASNIDVTKWNEKLGVGKIEEGNTGLINGGSVYTAINNAKTDMINVDDMNGAIRIGGNGKYDGYDKVDISKSDGTGRVMTGVVTDVNDKNSAANVGYVNAVGDTIINSVNNSLGKMDTKVNKVGANAAAMASLTPASYDGDEKWSVAAAIGHYQGESAGAVGAFYRPNDNMLINVRGSFGNGEDMVGAGVAISLDKGSMPGVSKRQLAKAVNTQAEHIKTLENSNQQLQQDNEQMRRMMMQMQERLEKLEKKDLEKK